MRKYLALLYRTTQAQTRLFFPRSLSSAFVIRFIVSIMTPLLTRTILIFCVVSVAEQQNGVSLTLSETQRFSCI